MEIRKWWNCQDSWAVMASHLWQILIPSQHWLQEARDVYQTSGSVHHCFCIWSLGTSGTSNSEVQDASPETVAPQNCLGWFFTSWHSRRSSTSSGHLPMLNEILADRGVTGMSHQSHFEIHSFSNASEAAYAACVCLQCRESDQSVTVRLLSSKSRVAPLRQLT
jgi:hypothetical protein